MRADAESWTVDDTHQAIYDAAVNTGVSYARLQRVVGCETGWTFEPYSVGDRGTSFGPVQLHLYGGEIGRYRARFPGHSLFDPYASIQFLAEAIVEGRATAWSCR